jgi:hypothetical protein
MDTTQMKTENYLYKEVSVWKRIDERTLLRYRCFQILPDEKYCVQSADFYSLPLDEAQINYLSEQFVELLIEEKPEIRAGKLYDSLQTAISAHDSKFQS